MAGRVRSPRSRTGWVAVVLVLAFVGAGCGSKATDGGVATITTVPGPLVLDEAELTAALLTVADLPSGWTDQDVGGSASSSKVRTGAVSKWASSLCESAKTPLYADFTMGVEGIPFMRQSPGTFRGVSLDKSLGLNQSLASSADAEALWRLLRGAFDSCVGQIWTNSSEWSMEALPAPAVGDEAVAYRLTSGVPATMSCLSDRMVLVRRDTVIEYYDGTEAMPGCESVFGSFASGEFDAIVTTGDNKVASALGEPTGSTTTTLAPTTAPTTGMTPVGSKPSCAEVQAAIAKMSPADLATLNKAPILFFSRLPGSDNGWRITALGDVTGTAPRPDVLVYYDWTPATGLGPPVVVLNPDDAKVLQGDDTSVTLLGMTCVNAKVNINP